MEYVDEPALVLMLADLPPDQFRLFHGRQPLAADDSWTALVHADPATPELAGLLGELADRTGSSYLFGGLTSSRERCLQWADEVFDGGLSGVAFGPGVRVVSRVTQGCQPLGPTRRITQTERNVVLALDGQPALPLLLGDTGVSLEQPARGDAPAQPDPGRPDRRARPGAGPRRAVRRRHPRASPDRLRPGARRCRHCR